MKKEQICTLLKKEIPAENIFDFTAYAPEIAHSAQPGQFLHILCGAGVFLRRPISICDAAGDTVRFIFEVKGEGTRLLSERKPGDEINILGPLGNTFIDGEFKRPAIIGGGIGVFPLYMLAKKLESPDIYLGFRSEDRVVMTEEFSALGNVRTATDDGSFGYKGFAAELLKENIQKYDVIYACGPQAMLAGVKKIAMEAGVPLRVSLEQRMGCGLGACLVCSCETVFDGTDKYKRVCKDGPVFWAGEVNI